MHRLRVTGETGTAFPLFRDAHVHLGLVDSTSLPAHGIGRVLDLGWAHGVAEVAEAAPVDAAYAGQFLTAPGGYPSDRSWAPAGSTVFVRTPAEAAGAVAAQVSMGARVVKVTLHSGGPVLSSSALASVVEAAHAADRPVVVHAEGAGTVELALAAGVDVLAHTPWTDRLPDDVVVEAAGAQRWISTLDIHGYGAPSAAREVAIDNLRRFHDAGGEVLYGTDLGNGPLPVGINVREVAWLLEAGLSEDDVLTALTGDWPLPGRTDRVTFVPGERVRLPEWLARARVVPAADLEGIT